MEQINEALEIIANQGINPSNMETVAKALKNAGKEIEELQDDITEMSESLSAMSKELKILKSLNNTKVNKDPKPENAIKK